MSAGRPRGRCRSPRITLAGPGSWPGGAGSDFVFCPGPADRGYKNFITSFTRRLAADPAAPRLSAGRCRATFICGHLAAGTPVGVLLAITGIAEAGSLARYARHVPGISCSKGALRARQRAERIR